MALDKLVDSSQLNGALTSTANAIRTKTGGTDPLAWDMDDGFEVAVGGILTPTDGSIPTKTSSDLTVSGATVTAPAGYYATNASKSVASGSATTPATNVIADPTISVNSSGLITATAMTTKSVTPTVSAGYVSSGTAGTINVSGSANYQISTLGAQTKYATTSDQTISTTGKYMTGNVTVKKLTSTNYSAANIKNGVTIKVNNSNADVFAVAGTFTKASTVSSGQTAATAGNIMQGYSAWVDGAEVKGSMSTVSVNEGTTTVSGDTATRGTASWDAGVIPAGSIGAATFANTATTGTTYVDISSTTDAPVLVTGDYLYINKGYTDNLKISLSRLVPDGASAGLASSHILNGYSAYNNDGTLIAGNIATLAAGDITVSGRTVTIPLQKYTGASGATKVTKSIGVGTVTSGTASITSLTRVYNSTNGNFDITGSADVSAPTVGTAGYVSSSEGTKSKKTGGATVAATVAKIVGETTITGTTTKTPSIAKQAISISGVTDAASGNATTTAPSSGVYVAVKSAASTGTLTATPSVTTAGYGDATNHGIAAKTATVGANASAVTYVPITTTTASVSGKTVSYGTGWITGGSKSVADGTVVASVSSNTGGSASMSATGFTASADETSYYVTLATSAGSVKAKATGGTAGYVTSSTTNETSATSVSVSGNGTKLYIPVGSYSSSVASQGTNTAAAFTPKVTGTISDISTTTAPSSGTDGTDYWTITPGGDKTTGKARAKATATIGTAGYIPTGSSTTSSYTTWDITTNVNAGTARYIPKAVIAGSSTNATATTTVAPGTVSISKQSTPSGVTNAASGNATTTAPSSGVYVAVKATAAANSTGTTSAISGSGTATVTGAGYAPTSLTGSVSVSGTATAKTSAKDSSMTYVPITTATPAFDGGTLSGGSTATGTNVTLSTTDNGMKVQTAYTAASTAVLYNGAVNGWVSKADNAEALAAQSKASTNGTAYYVTAVTMPKDKGFTVTTTADTALDTTSDLDVTNNAYRRVDITNKANGTVLVANSGNSTITSGSATAGNLTVSAYNSSGTAENNKSIVSAGKWVATTVSAAGTFYGRVTVSAGTITNNTSGGTSSGTINKGSQIKIGKGYYASDTYYTAQDFANGTITNNTSGGTSSGTINRGKQIKIGAGYYANDTYYTAQSNSGTLTISASGTTSCDGYANVSVAAGTVTNSTTLPSGSSSSGTCSRGKYVKIGAGYYPNDLYYLAQNNSGTLTVSTSHNAATNISCNGKTNVNVTGIYVPAGKSFTVRVPDGDSTVDFVFTVDSSGNVTIS